MLKNRRNSLTFLYIALPLILFSLLNIFFIADFDPSGLTGAMIFLIAVFGTIFSALNGFTMGRRQRRLGLPEKINKQFLYPSITTSVFMLFFLFLNIL